MLVPSMLQLVPYPWLGKLGARTANDWVPRGNLTATVVTTDVGLLERWWGWALTKLRGWWAAFKQLSQRTPFA